MNHRGANPTRRIIPLALREGIVRGFGLGVILLALCAPALGQVVLRGDGGRIDGRIIEIGPGGVVLEVTADGRSTRRTVGLDRIRRLDGEFAERWSVLADDADTLWRIRTRIERSDWAGAEALLPSLKHDWLSSPGPTSVVALDARLRCRAARGARAGAVAAWLELLGAYERAGAISGGGAAPLIARPAGWIGGVIDGIPVLDPRTGLAPSLPPIWVGEPALNALGESGATDGTVSADSKAGLASELASWYIAAARAEAPSTVSRGAPTPPGSPEELLPLPTGTALAPGEGLRLVRLIVQARAGSSSERAAARDSLRVLISGETTESWQEAWCRAAIGRSLLREDDRETRVSGIIELLHVPARLSAVSPYLAGVCLAEAAVALWDLGDPQAAGALKGELLTGYAGHPAANWGRLAEIVAPAPAHAPAAPPGTGVRPATAGASNIRTARVAVPDHERGAP